MKKIIINFAHPTFHNSRMNKAMIDKISGHDGITLNNLYDKYPDLIIDTKAEQELCESHDIIIFQYPMYWYSTPAIIKEWFDLVLEFGWACGPGGIALKGKYIMQAITIGGDENSYQKDGSNAFTINELSAPIRAAAKLCNMTWISPFTVYGINRELDDNMVDAAANEYKNIILALRDEILDIDKAIQAENLTVSLEPAKGGEVI